MIKNKNGFTGLEIIVIMAAGAAIFTTLAFVEGHFHGHRNCFGNAKCEGKKDLAKVDILKGDIVWGNPKNAIEPSMKMVKPPPLEAE